MLTSNFKQCEIENGGADRFRTGDLMLAKHALSQLSYSPMTDYLRLMVGLGRFELPTSPLSGVRSNQLSYRPSFGWRPNFKSMLLEKRSRTKLNVRTG
jgi:hypothetical protein